MDINVSPFLLFLVLPKNQGNQDLTPFSKKFPERFRVIRTSQGPFRIGEANSLVKNM